MQLVINSYGASVRKRGELFLIQIGDRKARVSVHKVDSILITTSAQLSTDAIQLAAEHHVDLVFVDRKGEPYGRFWHSKMGSTARIRRRQLEVSGSEEGVEYVLGWVATKLRNQDRFLGELAKRRPKTRAAIGRARRAIKNSRQALSEVDGSLEQRRGTIMGLEGAAGRAYFDLLSRLMPAGYRFKGRSRRPAHDPFNATLNYAYGVLYSHVERACIIAGLEPFLGLLHCDNYNRPSLVFDLIEPFRIWAERTVVHLFTGRKMKQDYFRKTQGGVSLDDAGKPVLIEALNKELEKRVRCPVGAAFLHAASGCKAAPPGVAKSRNLKQRQLIQREAHAFANALLGKPRPYFPPVETRDPGFEARMKRTARSREA
ncbi:MAG TPA: CRISPR-associated endonuclease Cas1 [Acidobacteriota bacterium]|nr:CRISPR-associated endonuclease Cas1 [Acidobacteriota bacterium]